MLKDCPQCNNQLGVQSSLLLFMGYLKSCPVCGTKIGFESTAKFQVIYQNTFTLIIAGAVIILKNNQLLLIPAIPVIFLLMFVVQLHYSKLSSITFEEITRRKDVTVLDFLKQGLYFPLRFVPIPLLAYVFILDRKVSWFFYLGFSLAMVVAYYWLWRDLKSGRTSLVKIGSK